MGNTKIINENKNIINIFNSLLLLYNIKLNDDENINIDDNLSLMIFKFNKWYYRILELAKHDIIFFEDLKIIKKKFELEIYPIIKNTNFEKNMFIQNMLFLINNTGIRFEFPNFIINIINEKYINKNNIIFDIKNINYEIIDSLNIQFIHYAKQLYNLIFDKIKNKYNIYKIK